MSKKLKEKKTEGTIKPSMVYNTNTKETIFLSDIEKGDFLYNIYSAYYNLLGYKVKIYKDGRQIH